MLKLLAKIFLVALLIPCVLFFIFYFIKAYFIINVDAVSGITTDGFGRPLFLAPWIMQYATTHWAGWKCFLFDCVVFVVTFYINYGIVTLIKKLR